MFQFFLKNEQIKFARKNKNNNPICAHERLDKHGLISHFMLEKNTHCR